MKTKHKIFDHLVETEKLFASGRADFKVIDGQHDGLLSYLPSADFNLIRLGSLDADFINELKEQKVSFTCFPKENIEEFFENFTVSQGFESSYVLEANLYSNLENFNYAPDAKIKIEKITDLEGLKKFDHIASIAFKSPEGFPFEIAKTVTNHPNLNFFIAYVDNNLAGCGLLSFIDDSAGLYWDGVLPEYRRQGIGVELVKHRMDYARKKGFKSICAQNMESSKNYYHRIGFKPSGTLTMYSCTY